jgi:hypothetical protein
MFAENLVTKGVESRRPSRRNDSHEEGPSCQLISRNRTVGVGERGLEMGEDLRCW